MATESMDSSSDAESVGSQDSDRELQIAFEQGLLKPGLNYEVPAPKTFVNDKAGLKVALAELKKDLPWVERLDMTNAPAPAPKALGLDDDEEDDEDETRNDFKREMRFYRQAQAAVLEGLPRLQQLGIPTRRPTDYFAEMAKTDDHMKRVREKLMAKEVAMERSEKARKLRDLRKYGKKVQQEVLQQRQKDKKEMMDAVKKYRKGKKDRLDFLDDDNSKAKGKQGQSKGSNITQPNKKRQYRNQKFGFGGQKKRSKQNTRDSARDTSDFNPVVHNMRPGKVKKVKAMNKRLGKSRRQKMKNKRK